MLVFNCTKAAAEFFTVTRKGEKLSCLEPAPHKTIAESVSAPVFPDDVNPAGNGGFQWHWVVHCVSVKRKKYLMVMDYHSRFCITFLAGKKGDEYAFLNAFEPFLKASFHNLALEAGIDEAGIQACIERYDHVVNTCAFHARSDRSVQAHLNDVQWHLERHCYEDGMLLEPVDLIGFNLFMGQFPRNAKDRKDHFFPNDEFLRFWMQLSAPLSHSQPASPTSESGTPPLDSEADHQPSHGVSDKYSDKDKAAHSNAVHAIPDNVVVLSDYRTKNR